jgi:uncharacterized protein YrzB (UPF0473 family)
MATLDGDGEGRKGPLELDETLTIETSDGESLPFEVVAILEDPENDASYAVLRHEASEGKDDEFIVTDIEGNLVDDDALAQAVLDDFLAFAEEEDDRAAHNGETT